MALLEGVDIVSINEGAMNSNGLSDRVILLPGELHRPGRPGRYLLHGYKSWALDIVPRLLRQRAGTSAADERPVRVIVPTTDQTLRRDAAHCQKTCHATWCVTWGPSCKCVAWRATHVTWRNMPCNMRNTPCCMACFRQCTTDQTLRRDAAHCQKTCHATWFVTWGPACKCVAWACNLVNMACNHGCMPCCKPCNQVACHVTGHARSCMRVPM
jgi:hypothetical protein